jgi:raffinose/stachyose/melibiose transport system substrate-binding protein
MELMGDWAPGLYETAGSGGLGDDLGWFPFPAVEGGSGVGDLYGGGDGFVVGADAPDTTLDFLRYLFSDASYSQMLVADPSMTSILVDADPPADPNAARQMETIRSARAMQLYLDADVPPEVSEELFATMLGLLARDTTPEDAIARITDRWQGVAD